MVPVMPKNAVFLGSSLGFKKQPELIELLLIYLFWRC